MPSIFVSLKPLFVVIFIALIIGFIFGFGLLPSGWLSFTDSLPQLIFVGMLPFYGEYNSAVIVSDADVFGIAGLPVLADADNSDIYEQAAAEANADNITDMVTQSKGGTLLLIKEQEDEAIPVDDDNPLVCIYCTHTTENYAEEKRGTQAGGVLKVAQELLDALRERGISGVLCETVHDYPDWSSSYGNSLASIESLKQQYPSLEVFIDVHRDSSIKGVNTILNGENGDLARMMFVVGSDQRLNHPLWQENQQFSQLIEEESEKLAPGISRGVKVSASRYNQHISTKAILVEVGSTDNSLDEAKASARILAEALTVVLSEETDAEN